MAGRQRDRFEQMLRAERLPRDFGPIRRYSPMLACFGQSAAKIILLARYPTPRPAQLHPADVPFFVTLCKTLGKPVASCR